MGSRRQAGPPPPPPTTDGTVKTMELSQLNLNLDRVENGQPGKVNFAANLKLDNRVPAGLGGTNDLAEGNLAGNFDFNLDQKLLPQTLMGNGSLAFARAAGGYADFAGLSATAQADVTPTEVRQLGLRFERGGASLGQVQASGPMDLAKSEGRLKIEVQSIDRHVLNLFGASRGWDFRDSTINATNFVDLARQGDLIGAEGKIAGRQMGIAQSSGATPVLDVGVDYKLHVNLNDQSAVIERMTLAGTQGQKEILRASLDRPMTLTWAPAARGFAESTFRLALTDINLQDWQSLIGTNTPSGRVGLQVVVLAKPDGKELTTTGSANVADFSAQWGTNRIDPTAITLGFDALVQNFKTITLNHYRFEARQRDQPLAQSSGSGQYDFSKKDVNLQASAEIALPALLRQFPNPSLTASHGLVRASSALQQKNGKYTLTGNVLLGDFTGTISDYAFQSLQTGLDYNVDFKSPSVQIHRASLTLRKGYTAAGTIGLSGNYNTDTSAASVEFKVNDVNENFLRPILDASMTDKKLVSISLGGNGSAVYDPQGESSLKAGLRLTNWVVAGVRDSSVSPKLSADAQVDGALRNEVLDLRQFSLKLSPTQIAKNELEAKGRLDLKPINATPSQLSVTSESLDLTPYYEMFSGPETATASSGQASSAVARQPALEEKPTEPEPAKLPFEQLTASVAVKQLHLRDLAITNLNVTAKINRGEVTLNPVSMQVNGAPVSATAVLNLGVPGYAYDFSFSADRVPIEPLSTTFTTNAPGVYQGDLIAQGRLQGVGVTGPSLQKNLSGSASLNLTNMNYEIVGRKAKRLLDPIAIALRVPELRQTPINWIAAQLQVGNGQIELQQFKVQSEAFYAESAGTVPMAEVLTNSPLKLPVSLSLRRSLAEKANLLAANTPTNAVYAQLPTFVTVTGTLGEPDTDINKVVIGGLLARSIGGIGKVGDQAGSILQNLGGVLSGQSGSSTRTNAPAGTNASPAANIIQGIGGLLNQPRRGAASTNAPAPSATNSAPSAVQDLLKLFPQRR